MPNINIELSTGDAIELYNHLHTIIRRNREEFDDKEIDFLARIKQKLSDSVSAHDKLITAAKFKFDQSQL